jgi:2-polyprenyl-6-methoxyphenol hydroxylase-like FAD-dependent oxidoreductase
VAWTSGNLRVLFLVMRVLISGAGIAGPTLAYWLAHYGFTPTIIEASPRLRIDGYLIDFWGAGFDVAERMGLLPEISSHGYAIREVKVIGRSGRRVAGFPAEAFSRITRGRFASIPRGALAASIFSKIESKVETIFGDSIDRIDQTEKGVQVTFERGGARDFDLVVGADGLHSRVREVAFGEKSKFEKYLGYKVAAFEVKGYQPRDELVYVMYTQVGQQVVRFAMRGDSTMFLFSFKDHDANGGDSLQSQKALLRKRFGNSGWECPQILEALDAASDLYFDRVSQIRMDSQQGSWTRGRVTLVGDAASCVSLLAGQGSALAMVGAYILAGELYRAKGAHALAFARYQGLFGPFVLGKQKAAQRFAGVFAPKSNFSLFVRNQIFNLLAVRWITDLAVGRDLAGSIALPNYE